MKRPKHNEDADVGEAVRVWVTPKLTRMSVTENTKAGQFSPRPPEDDIFYANS